MTHVLYLPVLLSKVFHFRSTLLPCLVAFFTHFMSDLLKDVLVPTYAHYPSGFVHFHCPIY